MDIAVALTKEIVQNCFGSVAAEVFHLLNTEGDLPLRRIVEHLKGKADVDDVRLALQVLLKRRFVGWLAARERKAKASYLYRACPNNVRLVPRYALILDAFSAAVSDASGDVENAHAKNILDVILWEGIIRVTDIAEAYSQHFADSHGPVEAPSADAIERTLAYLANWNVIVPATPLEMFDHAQPGQKRPAADDDEGPASKSARAMGSESESENSDSVDHYGDPEVSKLRRHQRDELRGFKPVRGAGRALDVVEANMTALMRFVRSKVAVALVRDVTNSGAAARLVLEAFNYALEHEDQTEAVVALKTNLTEERLLADRLESLQYGFARRNGSGTTFSVNFAELDRFVVRQTLLAHAHRRFGPAARTVMRSIMFSLEHAEEAEISKHALLSAKEVRQVLSGLLRAGLLQVREIYRTADLSATKTVFLWWCDEAAACTRLINDLQRTMYALYCRRNAEFAKLAPIEEIDESLRTDEEKALLASASRAVEHFRVGMVITERQICQLSRFSTLNWPNASPWSSFKSDDDKKGRSGRG
eukprot:Amastigsp_a1926_20.p1 type:complete len:534 gc:universal Amastigsp_a1926_20:1627-26(-)